MHFKCEKTNKGYKSCCHYGKVDLPQLGKCPVVLEDLLLGKHELSKKYLDNIRGYNSAMSFASFEANVVSSKIKTVNGKTVSDKGVPYFKISGY